MVFFLNKYKPTIDIIIAISVPIMQGILSGETLNQRKTLRHAPFNQSELFPKYFDIFLKKGYQN